MKKLLVGFIRKTDRGEQYHSAVVYMQEGYDHTKDVEEDYNPMDNFDPEENHLFPELRRELFENRIRWGLGSLFVPEDIRVMSVTFLGHADEDPSIQVDQKRMEELYRSQQFGPASTLIGTGI